MHFSIAKELFTANLQSVLALVPARTTYPVLQNILLETTENDIALTATDLDSYIRRRVETPAKPGRAILPGRKLFEIVRELSSDDLTVDATENRITISAGRARFNLPGLDPAEYPEALALPTATTFEMSRALVGELFESTVFAVSRDEGRPAMCGGCWEIRRDEMRMIATDGHRLAFIKKRGQFPAEAKAIIPPKVFGLLDSGGEGTLTVHLDDKHVGFVFQNTTVISRLIEGPYPDYERVVPKEHKSTLVVDREALSSALRRVQLMANPVTRAVKLEIGPEGIVLYAATPDLGEAKEDVACEYEGPRIEVGYNAAYLLEILRHTNAARVVFKLSSALSAGLVQPAEPAAETEQLYLLMPIRLD